MAGQFRTLSVATVALLGATGLAIAGGASKDSMQQTQSGGSMQQSQSGGSMQQSGSASTQDAVVLTEQQKQTIYQNLGMQAQAQQAPGGFTASVGSTLPSEVSLQEMPDNVSDQVPTLANYRYAKLQDDRLLIVDPDDRRVVSIIDQQDAQKSKTSQ